MENINKLTFRTYKVNEDTIQIPMEDIIHEYNTHEYSKPYLFKILYIDKQLRDGNYIVYLGPVVDSKLPIVKATIPLEIIPTKKILPYKEEAGIDASEKYIVNERNYREIDKINKNIGRKSNGYYLLIYGYLYNSIKNDNILTTKKYGVQELGVIPNDINVFRYKNNRERMVISNKWVNITKYFKKPIEKPIFKYLPDNFFVK